MQGLGSLISWWSLTGRWPTEGEVRSLLAKCDLTTVVRLLAEISVRARTWEPPTEEIDHSLVARLFPDDWISRIERHRALNSGSFVFCRMTVLFVLKEALQSCPLNSGGSLGEPEVLVALAECVLKANDLVLGYQPTSTDTRDQFMAGLLPFHDTFPQGLHLEDLARNLIVFDTILPTISSRQDCMDLADLFQQKVGMTYRRFCELAVAFATNPSVAESQGEPIPHSVIFPARYFSTTLFPPEEVKQFLAIVSTSHSELKDALQGTEGATDMGPIQKRPLLRLDNESVLVLDTAFLLDKAGTGLLWTLKEFLDTHETQRASGFLGTVFEEYAHWLWMQCYRGMGGYMANPRFVDECEAFDAVLLEGRTLVAIEYKSGMLRADAKHSFEAGRIVEEIEKKYLRSPKGSPKGIAQLRQGIRRFFDGQTVARVDLALKDVDTIHPLIVAVDPALTAPFIAGYLDEKLERRSLRCKGKKVVVAPLQITTFADIERLLPYTNSTTFAHILEAANRADKTPIPTGSLFQRARTFVSGLTPGTDIVRQEIDAFFALMRRSLEA